MRESFLHPITAWRHHEIPPAGAYDFVARRVREAGGPLDVASYSCGCGYVFAAPVSTSVSCPHCGASQAW
jgi:predicted Zn-ribbon and HTH transcriptional regulator